MTRRFQWTNASVMAFAGDADPVEVMEAKARELALKAMDDGWQGPPFDPLALAQWLDIQIEARGDIADARLVPVSDSKLRLEYNPMRPRGRLRFSIAHEIAHSLFPDCAEKVRNRGVAATEVKDSWQLEMLCNIGAAELLMPLGSFLNLAERDLSIKTIMELRQRFEVSVEACLIRLAKLARTPCAAFCASQHGNGLYQIDYVIPSPGWNSPVSAGQRIPEGSAVEEANAIGFTAMAIETWSEHRLRVECVGLAPYPGSVTPRVVGLLKVPTGEDQNVPALLEVDGDALNPRGKGPKLIAHVVPNTPRPWGGAGFASKVRRMFPQVWNEYRVATFDSDRPPVLGQVFFASVGEDVSVANMVAQQGFGTSAQQRLRYVALAQCLSQLREQAERLGASVHMPRVGTGHGGANWDVVRELITGELVDKGIPTTVYTLPA